MKATKILLTALVSSLIAFPVLATDREVDVAISPAVLILKNKAPAEVTVHANISMAEIIPETATLVVVGNNGPPVTLTATKVCEDDCGEVVAKFDAAQVKAAVVLTSSPRNFQSITLMFAVEKADHGIFSGTAKIRVK